MWTGSCKRRYIVCRLYPFSFLSSLNYHINGKILRRKFSTEGFKRWSLVARTGFLDKKVNELFSRGKEVVIIIGMAGLKGWSYNGVPLYWVAVCFIDFHTGLGTAKQASDMTYDPQKTYDKGHLVPAQTYSFTVPHMNSTFTYTNAVPQNAGFNRGQWALYENNIREYAKSECSPRGGDLYLITGISEVSLKEKVPGKLEATQNIPLKNLGAGTAPKVSIPGSMWTAGCCIDPSIGAMESFAVIGNNLKTAKVESVNMNTLQDFLLIGVNGFGGTAIELFPDNPKCSDPGKNVNLNKRRAT